MKDSAAAFDCDSASSCRDQIKRQLLLIVPTDLERELAVFSAKVLDLVKSPLCYNQTECNQSLDVRNLVDKWARVPSSSLLARERKAQALASRAILENSTCETPFDEESALAYDRRCEFLRPFSVFEEVVANRSVLFALRRELGHLGLLQEACTLNGRDAACHSVLQDAVQELNEKIAEEMIFDLSALLLVNRFWFFKTLNVVLKFVNFRKCGNVETPCVRELVAPILALNQNSDVAVFQAAMESAQARLFLSSNSTRISGLKQMIDLYQPPISECSIHKLGLFGSLRGGQVSCVQERILLAERDNKFASWDPASWLTPETVDLMKDRAQGCWRYCVSINNGLREAQKYLLVASVVRRAVFPLLLDTLCTGPNCVTAARQVSALADPPPGFKADGMYVDSPDKIFWVLGLTVHSILIIASVCLLFFGVLIWKVYEFVRFYVAFLCLSISASIFELTWWSLEAASSYANGSNNLEMLSTIGFVFSGSSLVVVTILLASLSKNWFVAFVYLVNGAGLSSSTENVISLVIVSVIVLLSLFGMGFGIAFGVYVAERSNFFAIGRDFNRQQALIDLVQFTRSGFEAVATTFFALCVSLAFFLVVSSAVGFVVLKKRGASKDDLTGIARFFVISVFLLGGILLRALVHWLLVSGFAGPRWFSYGVVYIGAIGVISLMFWLFCFFAFFGVHRQRSVRTADLSTELLVIQEQDDAGGKRVPKVYEI